MDRKMMPRQSGFSLIELMIVVAIVGIVSVGIMGSTRHKNRVNQINNDLHSISMFLKRLRLDALTQKVSYVVTVTAQGITTTVTPTTGAQAGVVSPGPFLNVQNFMLNTGSPYTLSTRGNYTTGNVRLDYNLGIADLPPANRLRFSCVAIDNVRVRLGEINALNGVTCDAI